jgi:hypothetical protein
LIQVAEQETNAQYHADTTKLSNSMLSILKRSPKLFFRYYIAQSLAIPESTQSMELGSMVHTMVLEPDEFESRYAKPIQGLDRVRVAGKAAWDCFEQKANINDLYIVKPEINRKTNEGKKQWEAFLVEANGRNQIAEEDYRTAEAFLGALNANFGKVFVKHDEIVLAADCCEALHQHTEFSEFMEATWSDRITEQRIDFAIEGIEMRCKPDYLALTASVIIDVKTTTDANPEEFAKSMIKYGYHRQAWLYREAVFQKYGIHCRFLFAVVSTEEPHEVCICEPSEAVMEAGRREVFLLLNEFKFRAESGDWISEWSKGIVPLDLPNWYRG